MEQTIGRTFIPLCKMAGCTIDKPKLGFITFPRFMTEHYHAKMAAINEIQQLIAELEEGQHGRAVCPYCQGGSSNERSLSITRSKKKVGKYMCFRASCELGSGTVMLLTDESGNAIYHGKSKKVTTTAKQYLLKTLPLWNSLARMLKKKYGLTDELLIYGNVRAMSDGRVAYTIFTPKRRRRGYVVRKYKDHYRGMVDYGSVPKAINHFLDKGNVGLSWYYKERHKNKQTDTLVLVEDIVSALKVSQWIDCCALLGTTLEPKRQKEVKEQRYKNVVLALDADANHRSVAIRKQTQNHLPNLKVKFLDKDFKDMTEEEIKETLKEYL